MTFEEARAHLGIESQRQWSKQAIARTTSHILFSLFCLVSLWAGDLQQRGALQMQHSARYTKKQPTFADAIASVRYCFCKNQQLSTSDLKSGVLNLKIPWPSQLILMATRAV